MPAEPTLLATSAPRDGENMRVGGYQSTHTAEAHGPVGAIHMVHDKRHSSLRWNMPRP